MNKNYGWSFGHSDPDPSHVPYRPFRHVDIGLYVLDTGTPLIGRFLGPRNNRLNRKPSY